MHSFVIIYGVGITPTFALMFKVNKDNVLELHPNDNKNILYVDP